MIAACSKTANQNERPQTGVGSGTSGTPRQDVANAATATPAATARPDEAGSNDAGFEGTAGTIEKKNPNLKESVIMSQVRSARHEGYDRVVFEFLGDQLPTYKIEYIDKPVRACGSGNVVPFAGDGWLSVRFSGAHAHTEEGKPTISDRERSPNLPVVKDLKLVCDFEAQVEWVMGNAAPNKYRLLELSKPTRLVVDVKH